MAKGTCGGALEGGLFGRPFTVITSSEPAMTPYAKNDSVLLMITRAKNSITLARSFELKDLTLIR
jgi:hypothetical protein